MSLIRNIAVLLFLVCFSTPLAQAQFEAFEDGTEIELRSGTLNIANSTDATLTIQITVPVGIRRLGRPQLVEFVVPPLSEKMVVLSAGYLNLKAIASKTAQQHQFTKEIAIHADGVHSLNITPQMFQTSFLADPPSEDNQPSYTADDANRCYPMQAGDQYYPGYTKCCDRAESGSQWTASDGSISTHSGNCKSWGVKAATTAGAGADLDPVCRALVEGDDYFPGYTHCCDTGTNSSRWTLDTGGTSEHSGTCRSWGID